jgi:hypothetical protein
MLLKNGGLCNGCITKRYSHNYRNVSYADLVSKLLYYKDKSKKISNVCCHVVINIGLSHEGKARKSKIRFVMQRLQNPPLCNSTVWFLVLYMCCWECGCVYLYRERVSTKLFALQIDYIGLIVFHIYAVASGFTQRVLCTVYSLHPAKPAILVYRRISNSKH